MKVVIIALHKGAPGKRQTENEISGPWYERQTLEVPDDVELVEGNCAMLDALDAAILERGEVGFFGVVRGTTHASFAVDDVVFHVEVFKWPWSADPSPECGYGWRAP